uniref:Uncharacterized protein n=1 Tax=Helianthus annuus TaxID=4232 RepID=A0A251UMK0_HELAN
MNDQPPPPPSGGGVVTNQENRERERERNCCERKRSEGREGETTAEAPLFRRPSAAVVAW